MDRSTPDLNAQSARTSHNPFVSISVPRDALARRARPRDWDLQVFAFGVGKRYARGALLKAAALHLRDFKRVARTSTKE
jgi:hypothetical protein